MRAGQEERQKDLEVGSEFVAVLNVGVHPSLQSMVSKQREHTRALVLNIVGPSVHYCHPRVKEGCLPLLETATGLSNSIQCFKIFGPLPTFRVEIK